MKIKTIMLLNILYKTENWEIFETPQFMYMMISATLFAQYPKDKRMSYVKKYYDAISTFKINIPTPVINMIEM